jgi:hypothetical protein
MNSVIRGRSARRETDICSLEAKRRRTHQNRTPIRFHDTLRRSFAMVALLRRRAVPFGFGARRPYPRFSAPEKNDCGRIALPFLRTRAMSVVAAKYELLGEKNRETPRPNPRDAPRRGGLRTKRGPTRKQK